MKISRMNIGSWGKVRAFFDLTTQDGFTIKGFKLIEGINGLFVSMPSQKGSDEEYYDTIWVDSKALRDDLNKLALEAYSGAQYMETLNETVSNNMQNVQKDENTSPAIEKEEGNKPFKDSDIPF